VSLEPSISDSELFGRIQQGDSAAFAHFYDRHAPLLFAIALKILGQQFDAEDVLQDAAVLIWERAPRYDPGAGQPLAWAVTLTRNRAIDRLRSLRRRTELLADAAAEVSPVIDPTPAAPHAAIASETGQTVQTALATLSSEQQQAIELAFFHGLTQQEIAQRLGVPLGTVKARIRRGMMTLRDILEGHL
jgi:RNA polymerase sigma-70 factor (ECF subfamily)